MLRPCLDCGRPSPRTRCDEHTRSWEQRRPSRRVKGRYDTKHNKLRAITLREHPWCANCRTGGSAANPLEADHILPHALGGKNIRPNYQTLCRACNAAKRDRVPAT
jgi:5-methylcytosine-specific restriction protein A